MKKNAILTLALFLLSAAALCTIHLKVNALKDQVLITEQIQYGSPAAADGLQLIMNTSYLNRLYWKTNYTAGETGNTQTKYTYYGSEQPYDTSSPNRITLENMIGWATFYPDMPEGERTGLLKAYGALYDATPNGVRGTKTVYLKEYYDYYPLRIEITLPNISAPLEEGPVWKAFNDYFRIPVRDTDFAEIYVDKRNDTDAFHATDIGEDKSEYYWMNSMSVLSLARNRCFLSINNKWVTENGIARKIDTSLIPGGYGIYSFRFTPELGYNELGTGLLAGGIETVLPLAEDAEVILLSFNEDESLLRIYTKEKDGFYLTAFDTDALQPTQKLRICDADYDWIYEHENVIAVPYGDGEKIAVVTEENGVYTLQYAASAAALSADLKDAVSLWGIQDIAYKDGKLAVAILKNDYFYPNNCDCYLLVFDKTGLIYCGHYDNGTGAGKSDYNNHNCNFDYSGPLRLRWE